MDRSTPFSIAFFTLHLIEFRGNREGNLATEQESNHHEISLTSSMANSKDYFPDVGGVYIKKIQVQLQASNFSTTVEQSGGGEVVVYCIMDRHT